MVQGSGPDLCGALDPGLDEVRRLRIVNPSPRLCDRSIPRSTKTPPSKALDAFETSAWAAKYPAAVATWKNARGAGLFRSWRWPATRKAIYTTNSIESLNYQLRKITKNRGHFPSDTAAVKLLWLAIHEHRRQTPTRTSQGSRPSQRQST
ncbi:transposase [Schaalia sp. ZJ405]|uniref:transposase n=1 Tax=Schaalia sp. ZJ405 TaxID=2709403 RepID=UPI0013ED70CB|nr:transposase [Schaalia sp. ZJ405]QPK82345.1 transposase [Schaalia sp. ZJ405]